MPESSQLTFDFLNKNETAKYNSDIIISSAHYEKTNFAFNTVFTDLSGLEEKHNNHSMAILGDCLHVLKKIKSNSIHLIFADAPYNIGKDFGIKSAFLLCCRCYFFYTFFYNLAHNCFHPPLFPSGIYICPLKHEHINKLFLTQKPIFRKNKVILLKKLTTGQWNGILYIS